MNNDLIKLALGYASFLRGNIMHLPIVASTTEEMAATFEALALRLGETEIRAEEAEKALEFYACADHYEGGEVPRLVANDKGATARKVLEGTGE